MTTACERLTSAENDTVPDVLRVDSIDCYYGASHVLQEVSLRIEPGQIVCLLGRNGAGKTTTVASIMGLLKPRKGRIIFGENDITTRSAEHRAGLGVSLVPQGRRIFPLLTVEENLLLGARTPRFGWTLKRVYELFPRLRERRRNRGNQLSGGEQQMLAIGRALIANPTLILMDEPSEGLAPLIVEEIYNIVDSLRNEGLAILLVEHSLEQAIELANRIYIMRKGQMVFDTANACDLTDELRDQLLGVG